MRSYLVLAALLLGLCLARQASAQSFGIPSNLPANSRLASTSSRVGPTVKLGSRFKLHKLFAPFRSLSNRENIGSSSMPAPGTKGYFDSFGYRRIQ